MNFQPVKWRVLQRAVGHLTARIDNKRCYYMALSHKCYEKPMKDPLGVSPSKGYQGTTRGNGKFF